MLPIQGSVAAMLNLANAGVAKKNTHKNHKQIFLSIFIPP
jgi:hypothetical protein